jgi:ankyrin repeat protein
VKLCCYFKNSDYLQKILEHFSTFDLRTLKEPVPEDIIQQLEVKEVINYDYLEKKKKIEFPNYRQILTTFEGMSPLHVAILRNSYECVRLLLEETNIDPTETTAAGETTVILACKHAVDIQILESLLVALRTIWPIEKMKEYLEFTDASQMRAYDYSKLKKRSDLAVVLEEFVDTSKSILDLAFTYVEPYDFKGALCRQLYSVEMNTIAKLNPKTQYLPIVEPFLKQSAKLRYDKALGK